MNDDLLKEAGGGNYFDELLERIRDILSSEKVFWRKVLDIYATSIDYDSQVEESKLFFKTIQNKMHWAVHGNTASEIIYKWVNANAKQLGLTNYKGEKPTKKETEITKSNTQKAEQTENKNVTIKQALMSTKIKFTGSFGEYFIMSLGLMLLSIITFGLATPYWMYWSLKYFFTRLEIVE